MLSLGLSDQITAQDEIDLPMLVPTIITQRNLNPTPPSTPNPEEPAAPDERPGPENTGPIGELSSQSGSINVTEDGAIIENIDLDGCINVRANNVTIRNMRIDCGSFYAIRIYSGFEQTLIEDVEMINMQSSGILGSDFTVRRANIHDSGGDALKPGSNVVVEASWLHKLGTIEGSHSDGIQMVSGSNVRIIGNFFDMPNIAGYTNSQCIILQTNNGPVDNIVVENNWLNGGGWCIQVNDKGNGYGSPQNILIKDNKFGPDCQFGTILVRGDNNDTTLINNVYAATGQVIGEEITNDTCGNDFN